MQVDNLIRMANQIGAFFEAMPNRPEALENLALHIKKFWEPGMRSALLDHLDRAGGAGLSRMAAEAIRLHRGHLR